MSDAYKAKADNYRVNKNKDYYQGGSNYRVKPPVKSFRDLEVYQKTVQLSNEVTRLQFLNKKEFHQDATEIKQLAENIPRLIAESYGDKFDSRELANKKITEAVTLITNAITKIDIFRQRFLEDKETIEILSKLSTNYQHQKRKVLNLRKAWQRIADFNKDKYAPTKYPAKD